MGRSEPFVVGAVRHRRDSDPKPPNSGRAIRLWHSCVDAYISNPQTTVVARSDHHGPGRKPGRAVAETHARARGASADRVRGRAPWLGRLRLAVRAGTLAGPAGVRVSSAATAWDMAGIFGKDLRLTLMEPQAGLSIRKLASPVGSAGSIEARGLDAGRLFDVRRDAHTLLDGGIADGRVDLQASTDALRCHVRMGARGARLGAPADNADDEPQLGEPTDVTIRFDGAWRL